MIMRLLSANEFDQWCEKQELDFDFDFEDSDDVDMSWVANFETDENELPF